MKEYFDYLLNHRITEFIAFQPGCTEPAAINPESEAEAVNPLRNRQKVKNTERVATPNACRKRAFGLGFKARLGLFDVCVCVCMHVLG